LLREELAEPRNPRQRINLRARQQEKREDRQLKNRRSKDKRNT